MREAVSSICSSVSALHGPAMISGLSVVFFRFFIKLISRKFTILFIILQGFNPLCVLWIEGAHNALELPIRIFVEGRRLMKKATSLGSFLLDFIEDSGLFKFKRKHEYSG